jgi:hypothetical protein
MPQYMKIKDEGGRWLLASERYRLDRVLMPTPDTDLIVTAADLPSAAAAFGMAEYLPPAQPVLPDPVPERVTQRQLRLAMLGLGLTAEMVEAQLANLPSSQKAAALIEWEYSLDAKRDHPLIASIGQAMGLTDDQVDDIFRAAEAII